jgi:hypothetical protein
MGNPGTAFEELNRELRGRGFELIEDVSDPEAFGSRYATYSREAESIRLIWDGKDEWLVLQRRSTSETAWNDIAIERVGRETANPRNIEALKIAVDTHFS